MFCKCIAVGNRRLSGNNQNTYCSLVFFFLFYISFATAFLQALICIASTSLQQDVVVGRGWEWEERWWHSLLCRDLPPQAALSGGRKRRGQGENLTQGLPVPARVSRAHLKFSSPWVFSQHEGSALSAAKAGKGRCVSSPGSLRHCIPHSTMSVCAAPAGGSRGRGSAQAGAAPGRAARCSPARPSPGEHCLPVPCLCQSFVHLKFPVFTCTQT